MIIQAKKYPERHVISEQKGHGKWMLTAKGGRKDGSTLYIYAPQYDKIQALIERGNGYVGENFFNDLWSQFEF
jgi:hypothetical protein